MVKVYIEAVSGLSRALAALATALIIAAMLVVCQLIMIRYVFRAPTIWHTDFVVFSATAAIFLGAPYVLLKGGHVGVDVVEMLVGPRTRTAMRFLARLLGLVFCIAMLVASTIQFIEAYEGNWKHASVWGPPLWVPLLSLPVGFGMLCLQYVAEILKLLVGQVDAAPVTPATAAAHEIRSVGEISASAAIKETTR
jgi:TRAP-type C4-dicarboxylate transport system permease small subunit